MSAFMFIGVLTILLAPETRKNFKNHDHNFIDWIKNFVILPFTDFAKKPK
jgi:hypothetical protein